MKKTLITFFVFFVSLCIVSCGKKENDGYKCKVEFHFDGKTVVEEVNYGDLVSLPKGIGSKYLYYQNGKKFYSHEDCIFEDTKIYRKDIIEIDDLVIGDGVIYGINSSQDVYIPKTYIYNGKEIEIKSMDLWDRSLAKNYIVDEDNKYFKTIDGDLYSKNEETLYLVRKRKEKFVIPDTVKKIGSYAFFTFYTEFMHDDTCERKIIISDSVVDIDDNAFDAARADEIVFGKGIKRIGHYAFDGALNKSAEIILPEGLESIGRNALSNYFIELKFYLPSTLKYICGNSIESYHSIVISEDNPYIKIVNNNLYSKDGKTLISYRNLDSPKPFDSSVLEGVKYIGDYAFYNTELYDLVIPEGVEHIGIEAFYDIRIENKTDIILPSTIKYIGPYAFGAFYMELDDFSYESVIENNAFNSTYADEIVFEKSIKMAEYSAFDDALYRPRKIILPEGMKYICKGTFYGSEFEEVKIPQSIEEIGEYAFSHSNIRKIELHGNLKLPEGIFFDCKKLETVKMAEGIKEIPEEFLYDCNKLKNVNIPNSVTAIGERAFYGCGGLKNILIPESVEKIGQLAFSRCFNLTIYCEAKEKPEGFNDTWNYEDVYKEYIDVVWGYEKGEL